MSTSLLYHAFGVRDYQYLKSKFVEEAAQAHLMDWILRAEISGVAMLIKFAKTLRWHAQGILAWYDYPISTGPLEGTNNKIKTMKRKPMDSETMNSSNLKSSPSIKQSTL